MAVIWRSGFMPLLIVMACFSNLHSAFCAEGSFDFVPHWKKGDLHDYVIVKTGETTKLGKATLEGGSRTDLRIEVLAADDTGWVIGWTQGQTKVEVPAAGSNPAVLKLSKLLEGLTILFKLDNQGMLKEVQNWKELRLRVNSALFVIEQELIRNGMKQPEAEAVTGEVEQAFTTQEQVTRYCGREAQMLFAANGGIYDLNKPLEYDDKLPSPITGELIPTKAQFSLKSLDPASHSAKIVWTQQMDRSETARVTQEALKQQSERLGKKAFDDVPLKIDANDRADFTVDTNSGWVTRMRHIRRITVNGDSRSDTTEIAERMP